MLGDHLGGTSLVNDANGQNAIETRYKAWGEVRYSSDQKVGVRFTGVNIPQDATIQNAWIQFTVDNAAADATALAIQAEASDNPGTFTSSSNNISSRTRTTASVAWTPVAWNTADEGGPDQRTPNLASVLQEIVNRPGWSEGNAVVFIMTGSGKRVAKSYNGDVYGAPYLHIEYTLPTPPTPTTLTIDYTYDTLHRITGATYSDGRTFDYTYDAAGNVLELQQNLGPGTVTTVYNYDAANQLNTAQQGSTTWQYTYDANGSLTEVLPGGTPANGAKRYTYNSAGNLVQVEAHNGTGWSTQAEMDYNGLNQRLNMDAVGVIATYVMNGDQPLTAETGGNNTYYLYGLGAIGEKTTAWNFSLPDGTNTPRQLSNLSGEITLSARYTPWGDTLELNGTGNFAFGYFGGVLDAATGLIYVGNGQYYDPQTGRFLTRDAKPNNTNPYVPWDPTGAIIAPLGIVALFAGRKKKGSKFGTFLVLLLVLGSVGMTLAACGGNGNGQSTPTPNIIAIPVGTDNYVIVSDGTVVGTATVQATPGAPNITVTATVVATSCATVETPIPTVTSTPMPSCSLCNSNPYAQMLLSAVLNNQNDLPAGFSVALLLAMAEQESGGNLEPFRNSTTDGGAMQLRSDSGHRSMGTYPDTPEGYEQNVKDAIAVIKEGSNTVGNMQGYFWDYLKSLYPGEHVVDVVRTVLYYNAGYGWVSYYKDPRLNPYPNPRDPNVNLNEGYLGEVAEKLETKVLDHFGKSDQGLIDPLKSAQHMVDCEVDPGYPAFNCK